VTAHPECIIKIGAEGGSITLFGVRTKDGEWQFARAVNDQTPTFLDPDEGGSEIKHTSLWVKTWAEALRMLDRYPWARLNGMFVHPEFRQRLWEAVKDRLEGQEGDKVKRCLERWQQRCGVPTKLGDEGF